MSGAISRARSIAILSVVCAAGSFAAESGALGLLEADPSIAPPTIDVATRARYPKAAAEAGIEGTVVLRVLVDRTGHVAKTEVESSPDDRLGEAAASAVKAWTYHPAMKTDTAVDVWILQPVAFTHVDVLATLDRPCDPSSVPAIAAPVGNIVLPLLVRKVVPGLPHGERERIGPERVVLHCTIDSCGEVRECTAAQSPSSSFTNAAIDSVRKWRYLPATQDGVPVGVYFTIQIDYNTP